MLNMMVNTNLMLIYDICYYAPSPWLLLIVLRNTHDNLTVIFIADRTVCVYQTALYQLASGVVHKQTVEPSCHT